MWKRLRSSVTAKLLALFLVLMAVFFAAFGWVVSRLEVAAQEKSELEGMRRRASSRSDAIKQLVVSMRDRVEITAQDGDVRRAMEKVTTPEEAAKLAAAAPRGNKKLTEGWAYADAALELQGLAQHAARDSLQSIFLVKVQPDGPLHGHVVYAKQLSENPLRHKIDENVANEPWFSKAIDGTYTSSFVPGPSYESVYFSSPITTLEDSPEKKGKTVGVLVLEISNQVLLGNPVYEGQPPKPGQFNGAFVVEANGRIPHELVRTVPRVFRDGPRDCPLKEGSTTRSEEELVACWRKQEVKLQAQAPCLATWLAAWDTAHPLLKEEKIEIPHDETKGKCAQASTEDGWFFSSTNGNRPALIGVDAIDAWNAKDEKNAGRLLPFYPRWYVISVEYTEDWRNDELGKRLGPTMYTNGAALLATCGIMIFVLSRMVRDLREVLEGTQALAGGNLAKRIPVRSEDEIGHLAEGFNDMASKLAAAQDKMEQARKVAEEARGVAEEAKDRADEANAAKSTFLANMSHELRTPLNAIIGYSEMLAEDSDDDAVKADLEKIRSAGKHLLALIGDLLDISKIEAGKMTLYYESVDLRSLIDDVVNTVKPLVAKNQNELVVERDEELGIIRADLMKLRQSLFNLLSNATKFTNKGKVTLAVRRKGGRVTLAVSDTGIGITEQQMDRLFKAFSQADDSTTRKYGGTGLGLVLTKKFVELMGGSIDVKSVSGEGTTFTLDIPTEPAAEKTEATAIAEAVAAHAPTEEKPGRNVLVIDDDAAARDLMHRALAKAGFGVRTASGGTEGLAEARRQKPDVIVLDVAMPDMDGWTVLNAVKADPALRDVPVVMMSILDERERGAALGAADYVNKPIDWEHLSGVLGKMTAAPQDGHVLVVDDDPGSREMARRMLEKAGYTVREAENGRIALEQIEKERPALVLLDLMMPELSGFDVIVRLQKSPQLRTIPVVVMTAKDLTAEDRARLTAGVQHVYQKGALDRDELVAQVRGLVSARA